MHNYTFTANCTIKSVFPSSKEDNETFCLLGRNKRINK